MASPDEAARLRRKARQQIRRVAESTGKWNCPECSTERRSEETLRVHRAVAHDVR